MPQFGTIKRAKSRVRVLRGYNPNEPFTRTASFPVHQTLGVTDVLLSGQVIYALWNASPSGGQPARVVYQFEVSSEER